MREARYVKVTRERGPPKNKAQHGKTQKAHHTTKGDEPAGAKPPRGMPVHARRTNGRKHNKV